MTTEDRVVAGRYRLGSRIGSGAMGVVWQAHDERLHRTVAIKQLLLHPELSPAQAEEARLRSMREGRIAARLSHPNAVTVYDVAEHRGEPWLVMEYLPSRSLAAVIADRGALPPEEVARIGTQVAAALIAAHSAGIVHRDVKPANVLLGDDGTVKITDFGISRATGDVTVTATGMLAGTPAYLAPEVAKGREPTAASDVFSLGSTLYTAVEGHSPFGLGENTLALLYAVAAGRISPPRQAGPLTALLMSLLRVDPTERLSMVEARDGLAAVAAGRPVPVPAGRTELISGRHAAPPSPPHGFEGTRLDVHPLAEPPPGSPPFGVPRAAPPAAPPGRTRRGRSVLLTVLAVVAAALVGILVASLFTDGRPNSQAQQQTGTSTQPSASGTTTTQPAPSTTTSSTTTAPASTTTTAPPVSSSAPSVATPAATEAAVRQFLAQLPGNPAAGYELLSDAAKSRYGSVQGFAQSLAGITAIEVLMVRSDTAAAAAFLQITNADGNKSSQPYVFTLVEKDGRLLIEDWAQGRSTP
ncbi:MAG TPA: serine/threonine-protein kinase [Actinophytocola sp.]|uniref:serine/threonine-protein kinase n=1 Tax=Actinophytocola sp. TaxID=1872138 RepID=UPI002DBC4460|nr:serine/threonine-protein kinase [Actinophytocola sp.]HEU5471574.1 serine/threonine-protein kinase [Actinophytocola sp.]